MEGEGHHSKRSPGELQPPPKEHQGTMETQILFDAEPPIFLGFWCGWAPEK